MDRYHRQQLFAALGRAGDERLRGRGALIVGCGALGGHIAVLLARAGVGRLRLVDRDVVEWTNLHRQVGFTEEDARRALPKAEALAAHLRQANSEISIEPVVADFNARCARELARGADLLIDGTDNLPARFLLNDLSLALGLPWIYGGAVGEDAHAQMFFPGRGPCLRCILPELPPAGELPTCDTAGIIGPAAAAAASFEAALALRCLADPEGAASLAGRWVRLRVWAVEAGVSLAERDPACRACGAGELEFLEGKGREEITVLCGREAVQVLPAAAAAAAIDLEALADRLSAAGEVERRRFLIRFRPAGTGQRLTIFPDGRAIIEGTAAAGRARALYDRFVGQ